jgi:hypothetical protein
VNGRASRAPKPSNVIILGCGRSGTSIFGELFAAFPGYLYLSEPLLADVPLRDEAVAVKVPRTGPHDDPPDGAATSLRAIHAAVGEPRTVFWQVRHPLDAICSLRIGIADGWGHHPRPADWEAWVGRPLLERCAHHWATINGPGYQQVADHAVVNRFEDLIADPRACANRTAAVVGADVTGPAVEAWIDRVQDTDNDRFIEAETSRPRSSPDHVHRVGRWQENLTSAEVDSVRAIVTEGAAGFGYDLP